MSCLAETEFFHLSTDAQTLASGAVHLPCLPCHLVPLLDHLSRGSINRLEFNVACQYTTGLRVKSAAFRHQPLVHFEAKRILVCPYPLAFFSLQSHAPFVTSHLTDFTE